MYSFFCFSIINLIAIQRYSYCEPCITRISARDWYNQWRVLRFGVRLKPSLSLQVFWMDSSNSASAQVTLDWHYRVQMWPNPSDSGSATITISQTTVLKHTYKYCSSYEGVAIRKWAAMRQFLLGMVSFSKNTFFSLFSFFKAWCCCGSCWIEW